LIDFHLIELQLFLHVLAVTLLAACTHRKIQISELSELTIDESALPLMIFHSQTAIKALALIWIFEGKGNVTDIPHVSAFDRDSDSEQSIHT
jgi:hypothetical protein